MNREQDVTWTRMAHHAPGLFPMLTLLHEHCAECDGTSCDYDHHSPRPADPPAEEE